MNRYFLIITIILGLITSCDDEDICIENSTPKLNILVKNSQNDTINLDTIFVYREQAFNQFELKNYFLNSDSISVSLPVENQSKARYIFGTSSVDLSKQDTLTVDYTYYAEFVSKACGYKVQYYNTTYAITNHFFNSLDTLQNEVTSQNIAHIQLNY